MVKKPPFKIPDLDEDALPGGWIDREPAPKDLPHPGLRELCLNITGAFEGPNSWATCSGNFDKSGLSCGLLQWNLGQGTLQPLLQRMLSNHRAKALAILGPAALKSLEEVLKMPVNLQVAWGDAISNPKNKYQVLEPWKTRLKSLFTAPEMKVIQSEAADGIFQRAVATCQAFGIKSVRGLATLFDLCVQQGGIKPQHRARIMVIKAGQEKEKGRALTVNEYLRVIAQGRAEFALPQWQADCLSRRNCIIDGHGTVHGQKFDLDRDYGLNDGPAF